MLLTKLLAQTANKNLHVKFMKFMFTETGQLLFFKYGFKSDCPEKFLTNTSIERKGNCPETCYRILVSYF